MRRRGQETRAERRGFIFLRIAFLLSPVSCLLSPPYSAGVSSFCELHFSCFLSPVSCLLPPSHSALPRNTTPADTGAACNPCKIVGVQSWIWLMRAAR